MSSFKKNCNSVSRRNINNHEYPSHTIFCKQTLGFLVYVTKVLMLGKLIAVAYSLHIHIETSSLLEGFVNKNRCISVRLVSEEDFYPQFNFEHFDNSIKVSYDQNISLFFFSCEKWIPCVYFTARRSTLQY